MGNTGFIELSFNVLFLVCVDKTNNSSQTALPKDVTKADSGKQTGSGRNSEFSAS